jgi:hypothetical protein
MTVIDVHHLVSTLLPVRKAGRPTKRSKALERDENPDVMALCPGDMRKTCIRHETYLNGVVYDYRLKPNKIMVWCVRFPDAPGGLQEFEMDENALTTAIELFKIHMREATQIVSI